MNTLKAGVTYFAIIFALGFAFGTIRVLILLPHMGEMAAVLMEGPFILGASWFVCTILVRRFAVAANWGARITMGALALILLLFAELLLGVYGFGQTLNTHFAHYATLPGGVGLGGQILFGVFPVFQLFAARDRS